MVLFLFLIDFVTLSLSTDNVRYSPGPETWDIKSLKRWILQLKLDSAMVLVALVASLTGAAWSPNQTSTITTTLTNITGEMGMGDFVLPIVDRNGLTDKNLTLSDFRGKVIALEFMAPWCPPCQQLLPFMESLTRNRECANVPTIMALMTEIGLQSHTVQCGNDGWHSTTAFLTIYAHLKGIHSSILDGRQQTAIFGVNAEPSSFPEVCGSC